MEILCVMAALAALFLGSAALTLKARVPAGLAPLVTLSCIVAVLTLAGMAGMLYPAAWAVYALCAAGGVWALLPPKEGKKRYYAQLATPGSVIFWALALAFAVYFFVRQPMATVSDEFSLWATAVKVTKVDNSLYSTASLGTPWAVTQNPGLPLLSYFFQFFGRYADWKIYLAYDVLFFAVYAAVLSVLPWKQWRAHGCGAVGHAVFLHGVQSHHLPDYRLPVVLRRYPGRVGVRQCGGCVAGPAPTGWPPLGCAAGAGPGRKLKSQ